MSQVQEQVEEQVRRLSADVGGDFQRPPDAAARTIAGGENWGPHPVNLRLSIPLLFGRYYLTVVAGKERRHPERRADERRKHPLLTFGNLVAMFGLGTVCGLALLGLFQLAGAYVLTQLGIMVVSQ